MQDVPQHEGSEVYLLGPEKDDVRIFASRESCEQQEGGGNPHGNGEKKQALGHSGARERPPHSAAGEACEHTHASGAAGALSRIGGILPWLGAGHCVGASSEAGEV